jgi:hypothetical protein
MSFILTKSMALIASAVLLTGTVAVSASRGEPDKPHASAPSGDAHKGPPSVCKYGGDSGTEADAVEYCGPILQCQAPKVTKCRKGTQGQGWICRCN